MEPVFLSLDEVLEIHEQQIERYGGSTFGGEFLHASVPAMAAAYLVNDWEPAFDELELVDLVVSVASGRLAKPGLIAIFESRCRAL